MATESAASGADNAPRASGARAAGAAGRVGGVGGSRRAGGGGGAGAAPAADLDRTLAALAEPQRRAIVEALRDGELRPSELADRLAISRPALSRHLRVLRQAGLVTQQAGDPDARARPIRLQPEQLGAVRHWLESVEAFWADQLVAFKRHAEGPARGDDGTIEPGVRR